MSTVRLVTAAAAANRLAAAADWLARQALDTELLIVGPTWEAADDAARLAAHAGRSRFGLTRLTLDRLAARLAARRLAHEGRAPASALSFVAVVARAVHQLLGERALGHFAPVALRPGFAPAIARTLEEVRMNGVGPERLRGLRDDAGGDLAALAERVERELADGGLADRALIFAAATAVAGGEPVPRPVGLPLLLLDLAVTTVNEERLVAALVRRAPDVLATVAEGDERTLGALGRALGCRAASAGPPRGPGALGALQVHLFGEHAPAPGARDDSVTMESAPGEARECVEIARRLQAEAASGVAFDRMAIFLHAPGEYTAHLEEALRRAGIPAFFARGAIRPHPAGRALLALLACAAEKLSARRFAEYLSLAQVPDPGSPTDSEATWAPPLDDLLPVAVEPARAEDDTDPLLRDPAAVPVIAGTLRTPWRWEQLLVDAAVIGGRDRWVRRLDGLENQIRLQRAAFAEDEGRAARAERTLADLAHLREFALPILDRLAALPRKASWGVWLEHLRGLAAAALRHPVPVLEALAELEPMAPVGEVDLDEVELVLGPRLRDLPVPPPRRRYGAVFVAPTAAARGLAFDVVFVPGLAERLFPKKIVQDPILRDAARAATGEAALVTQADRTSAERLALRLAVGAARRSVHLSYPRLDVEQARPRVPSFYALEALRAAEGRLPSFEELGARAADASGARLGWPAPERSAAAIDEAEFDLAVLAPLMEGDAAAARGSASYLLSANAHLARALRARARRWLRRWTAADGLVEPGELAREALARHQLAARSFSPTALQHFAACPYRFFLQAIHRLEPREEPVAIEALDPLSRGALVHDVQFALLSRLQREGALPVRPETRERAIAIADETLDDVARIFKDRLAPAIERVWEDGITTIRADLHEWLRRQAAATDGWVPHRFELSFGIVDRDRTHADPSSIPDPVELAAGLRLRGAIDLVERREPGVLRVTDYKTGRVWAKEGVVVGGGETLQPLFYALACERILAEPVEAGRLYYCTADGGYAERVVRLDTASRAAAAEVVAIVDRALQRGFLPAAPRKDGCRFCDFRPVCGPLEEARTSPQRKPHDHLADLLRLRSLP